MVSSSSSNSRFTVSLPTPTSTPPRDPSNSSVSSTLDVHVRWTVKPGSLVLKGERIAQLIYTHHADDATLISMAENSGNDTNIQSNDNGNNNTSNNVPAASQRSIIRARMKKRSANGSLQSSVASSVASSTVTATGNSNEPFKEPNSVSLEIRSPANGFIRIIYTKPIIPSAIEIRQTIADSGTTAKCLPNNIILAAIEPCEHPAMVGDLCAVCGCDIRAPQPSPQEENDFGAVGKEEEVPKKQKQQSQPLPQRKELYNEVIDAEAEFDGNTTENQSIIDLSENSNLLSENADNSETNNGTSIRHSTPTICSNTNAGDASSIIDSTKTKKSNATNGGNDEFEDLEEEWEKEFQDHNSPAAKALDVTEAKPVPLTKPAPKPAKRAATTMRSLSSLLSGVKTTQKMQQTRQPQQPQPQRHAPSSWRNRNKATSSSSAASLNNPSSTSSTVSGPKKMTQMTVSGGVTLTISESEAKSISEADSKKLRESKQLCLVMDLDHTLLHATDDYRAGRFVAEEIILTQNGKDESSANANGGSKESAEEKKTAPNPDNRQDVRSILLPVDLPPAQYQQYVHQKQQQQEMLQSQSKEHQYKLPPLPPYLPHEQTQGSVSVNLRHYVKLRPHLKEFFNQIQSTYKLSVYTAGTRAYAEQIAVMICRHLVNATLDEEELQVLRSKVREKEEECRRYREYKARIGRKKQLELAKERDMGMDIEIALDVERERNNERKKEGDVDATDEGVGERDGAKSLDVKREGKSVSFANACGESMKRAQTNDDATKKVSTNETSSPDEAITDSTSHKDSIKKSSGGKDVDHGTSADSSNNDKQHLTDHVNTPNVTAKSDDCECTSASSMPTSQKRSNSSGEMTIPRKKKRVAFGSLLPLVPPPNLTVMKEPSVTAKVEEVEMKDPTDERDQLRKVLEEAERLEIAAIDLRRKLFGSRIVSRTDVGDLGKDVKSLKRVFPCGGVMAAIIDDREDVWANANNNDTGRPGEPPDNLLLVKPYHWKPFSGYADVNNASGNDLSENVELTSASSDKHDNKEDDVQLLWTADILKRLHKRYYSKTISEQERDELSVPSLLRTMRKEVLRRHPQAKIVFSGLIPICKQNVETQIRPHVVRYSEELGAEVLPSVSNRVTHIVAARDGTDKIKRARVDVPQCYVVHTAWLMECYWSLTRRDVRPHHMGPLGKRPQVHFASEPLLQDETKAENKMLLIESDDEESDRDETDDDDFAAELENEMMNQKNN